MTTYHLGLPSFYKNEGIILPRRSSSRWTARCTTRRRTRRRWRAPPTSTRSWAWCATCSATRPARSPATSWSSASAAWPTPCTRPPTPRCWRSTCAPRTPRTPPRPRCASSSPCWPCATPSSRRTRAAASTTTPPRPVSA